MTAISSFMHHQSMSRRWLRRHVPLLRRLAVVLGVLGLSAVFGVKLRLGILFIKLMVAGLGGLLFLRKPWLGLVALVPASLLVPIDIGTGSQSSINVSMLLVMALLGLWVFNEVAQTRSLRVVSSRPLMPLLALALVSTLSFAVGQLNWYPVAGAPVRAQIGGLAIFLLSVGAFVWVADQVRETRPLRWLTWSYLALGAVYIIAWTLPSLKRIATRQFVQGGVLSLFWTWMGAMALAQALFNDRLPRWGRVAVGGLGLLTFWVAWGLNGDWKSGWVPLGVALGVILCLRFWRVAVATALAAPIVGSGVLASLIAAEEYSYSTRLDAWMIILQITAKNPLLGLGPANYYWYTPLYAIRGYYVEFNSHNQYFDLLAQTGILGLICFIWFAWEVFRLAWRLRHRVPRGFERAYVFGALGGLAGTMTSAMLGDWVLPFVYNVRLDGFRSSVFAWLFLGGLVVLEQLYDRPSPADAETTAATRPHEGLPNHG